MIKLTDVLDYQTWFNGLNLEKEDLCIALVGGSNTILNPQDPIQSSRELVAALKQFFDEKSLSVQYEDLYAENEQMNTRHIDLINGNLKIETEIHSAITYENLDENMKEIDLNDLIQPSSQLSGRFTP
ncbi:MAG: hypothetical protein QG556_73 [Pseudomonadota bacterium]|nr:hypothetical protein [Pseudomonadota bacterium]